MDKKALLDELKIDRAAPRRAGRPLKILVPLAILGGLAVVGWAFGVPLLRPGPVIEVEAATARAAADAAPGQTVLDATGYVVARRQATVSSKATGKVLDVFVEEGMVVEEGQLLAGGVVGPPRRVPGEPEGERGRPASRCYGIRWRRATDPFRGRNLGLGPGETVDVGSSGAIRVNTTGTGIGPFADMNEVLGRYLFGRLDDFMVGAMGA